MTKTIGDKYIIYSLIIILDVIIVVGVRCGLSKMSNVNHLTMLLLGNEEKKLGFFGKLQAPLWFLPHGLIWYFCQVSFMLYFNGLGFKCG